MNADEKLKAKMGSKETGESLDRLVPEILRDSRQGLGAGPPETEVGESGLSQASREALDALGPNLGRKLLAKVRAGERMPIPFNYLTEPAPSPGPMDEASSMSGVEWDVPESMHGESVIPTVPGEASTRADHAGEEAVSEKGAGEKLTMEKSVARYKAIIRKRQIGRTRGYALRRLLGKGGQGRVFLTERRGADGFDFVAAIKLFSPGSYSSVAKYEAAMRRIARVASLVAQAHHPNLVDVLFFEQRYGVRMMLMELVDGFDLRRLLKPAMHDKLRKSAPDYLWDEINKDLVTFGRPQLRMRPGFAVAIVRDCLAGLALLHRRRIVHGDIKPSNIMVDRISGHAKLVDLGSAFDLDDTQRQRFFTPAYAAPEVLERRQWTPQSDLASLGYVLIELLAGRRLFTSTKTSMPSEQKEPLSKDELLRRKKDLPHYLSELLPVDVGECGSLMGLCRKLTDPDPAKRFLSADHADLDPECGAYVFQTELIRGYLAKEFGRGIRDWLEALR